MTSRYAAHDSVTGIFTTELNALANDATKITSAALSNDAASTERRLFASFRLDIAAQGAARDANAKVDLYIIPEVDTDFAYGGDALIPSVNHYRGSFYFDAATTARTDVIENVNLPNSDYHVLLHNRTGQELAGTGNILEMERGGYEDV